MSVQRVKRTRKIGVVRTGWVRRGRHSSGTLVYPTVELHAGGQAPRKLELRAPTDRGRLRALPHLQAVDQELTSIATPKGRLLTKVVDFISKIL